MEHNLGDTLNLESAMGSMDFDHSNVVETSTHEGGIPMEFEHIEEEQMMMDTGNEEIIVSDFIGDQFTLQEYCIQKQNVEQTENRETVLQQANQLNVLTSQPEQVLDFQYEPENVKILKQENQKQPKFIAVKSPNTVVTKNLVPKQVMIAPKPPNFPSSGAHNKSVLTKQYAIAPKPAPKPVQLVKSSVMKVSLANLVQGTNSKPILAQLGGKLLMLPSKGPQKIKLLPASSGAAMHYVTTNDQQQQLIATKVTQAAKQTKPVITKVTVQGQTNVDPSNQPAVLTKILPIAATGTQQARYVMQQKTVPISLAGNKIIFTSPTKQSNVKFTKTPQLVTVNSQTPKLLPAPTQVANQNKVVIAPNPNQNVILKTSPTKTSGNKESSLLLTQSQRAQVHQINVPGKGVQYIRLVANNNPAKAKTGAQANTFMLADAKGNLIPVSTEKIGANQPPLLVITGNMSGANKAASKSPKKLVRLAPIGSKTPQVMQQTRPAQSLLAPMSPSVEAVQAEEFSLNASSIDERTVGVEDIHQVVDAVTKVEPEEELEETDMARSMLIQNAELHKFGDDYTMTEVTVEYESEENPTDDQKTGEIDCEDSKQNIHPLIVIPSNYKQFEQNNPKEKTLVFMEEESEDATLVDQDKSTVTSGSNMMNVEAEIVPYTPSPPPINSDSEMVRSNDLGRPRKACNCTKSQCLKLYCDCFANGEFCNTCNCNNCHNNLENEELRQKAIRACLDRNPNAFRPKIGKSKVGGPELVRRHNKGCNCKRSGCLKNYCECFEAKIECTATCKCVGCRNVEDLTGKRRGTSRGEPAGTFNPMYRPPHNNNYRLPCSFVTTEVIEAVCQCLIASASQSHNHEQDRDTLDAAPDPMQVVIEEFARCLQDIIGASHQAAPALSEEVT